MTADGIKSEINTKETPTSLQIPGLTPGTEHNSFGMMTGLSQTKEATNFFPGTKEDLDPSKSDYYSMHQQETESAKIAPRMTEPGSM